LILQQYAIPQKDGLQLAVTESAVNLIIASGKAGSGGIGLHIAILNA